MRTRLRTDLTGAMKARDRVAVTALRSALAAIENAEAVPTDDTSPTATGEHVAGAAVGLGAAEAQRRHLTEADVRAILEREIDDRTSSATEYDRLGRDDLAASVRAEADILRRYLT